MSITLRTYMMGYNIYASERSMYFHSYAKGENFAVRNKVPHFWENANNFRGVGKVVMARLLGIFKMNPEVNPATLNHKERIGTALGGRGWWRSFTRLLG